MLQDEYTLQNSCVLTTYIPARLDVLFHLPPELFFKLYICAGIALVPVLAHLIARRYLGDWMALFAPLFVIGWVAFYQGGSFARLNFAMIFYGLLLLALLSSWPERYKYPVALASASALVFAHYGTALVAGVIFFGVMVVMWVLRQRWQAVLATLVLIAIVVSFLGWQGVINQGAWRDVRTTVAAAVNSPSSATASSTPANNTTSVVAPSVLSRYDKIIQAAFGSSSPDRDNTFQFSWWMFGFAWLTVMLLVIGSVIMIWRKPRSLGGWLCVGSLLSVAIPVLLPVVSRDYGMEKVYYQAIMVLAVCVVIGGQKLAKWIRLPSVLVLLGILLPYVLLMWRYGVIHSALG